MEVTSIISITSSRSSSRLNTSRSIGSCFIEAKRLEAAEGQGGGVVSGDARLDTGQLNAEQEIRDSAERNAGLAVVDVAAAVNIKVY